MRIQLDRRSQRSQHDRRPIILPVRAGQQLHGEPPGDRRLATLAAIPGSVPSLLNPPTGCRFAARCKYAMDICVRAMPPLKDVGPGHRVACVL